MSDVFRNEVLVIDDAFLLAVHHLTRKVNLVVKHPDPILKLDAPWEDRRSYCLAYMNVLYDESEKLFKMWYIVGNATPDGRDVGNEPAPPTAYAVSHDGIYWEKPILNRVEFRGSTKNNYVFPGFDVSILRDPSDAPARRYKMLFADGQANWARFHMPLSLAYSADGIHWGVPLHVNPIHRGVSDGAFEFFYDEDRRRYQIFSRRVPNLPRDISLYESYDLVNWEDRGRVLVAGDEHDPPGMFNFHGMVPFRYKDFHLALLNTMYSLPGAETYENYNAPPPDYPDKRLGQIDIQLAYSRDGVQWSRPEDLSAIVPNGEPGSPDEGIIFAHAGRPVVLNGQTWIYYTGRRDRHNYWSPEQVGNTVGNDWRKMSFGMLAKIPEDHWVSLDAGSGEGWFLTKPYGSPSRLLVNADAKGGRVEAEILTPYGRPVEGFTRADCVGISGNGKDQEIRWTSKTNPRDLNQQHRGGLCLKFYLTNAKLYSYTLVEPDPDGTIKRYWDNARWNEAIMHRRDNWSRNSNEPADGLRQPTGTQNSSGTRFGPNPRAKGEVVVDRARGNGC